MTAQGLLLMTLLAFEQTTCSSDQQKLNTAYKDCMGDLAVTSGLMGYYWLTEQNISLKNLVLPTAIAILLWSNYRTCKQVSTLRSKHQQLINDTFDQATQALEDTLIRLRISTQQAKIHKLESMLNKQKPQRHRRFSTGSLALPPATFDPRGQFRTSNSLPSASTN